MKKEILYTLISIVVLLVLIMQIDDKLSDEAKELLSRIEVDGDSESYLFLLGIFANENENPVDVGRVLLEEYEKVTADDSYAVVDYPSSEKLPLPSGDAFCAVKDEGCLAYLFSDELDIESLLNENATLISRSNQFIEYNEYTTLQKPTIREYFPPYQYLIAGERLIVLDSILIYSNGNAQGAIDSLLKQFVDLRRMIESQDTVVGKVILLMRLSEVIDVISVILSEQEDIGVDLIPSLSVSERSFSRVSAREFGSAYNLYKSMDRHTSFFKAGGNIPGWITRMVYKPNMTSNSVTSTYTRLEYMAQLTPLDFSFYIEKSEKHTRSTSRVRNYFGNILIGIPFDNDEYIARFFDLDAKLALFNQYHHLGMELNDMVNPYYGAEVPKVIDGKLCFSGPMEDEHSIRCLRIGL